MRRALNNMQYRILGETGLEVGVIGFGGIPIQRLSSAEAIDVVNRALDLGINFFDSARTYGDSEQKLGAALKERRKEAVIATKSMAGTYNEMFQHIEEALEKLQTNYIDIYQIHNVKTEDKYEELNAPGGAIQALEEAKKDGVINHIGISSHNKKFLTDMIKGDWLDPFKTVQFPFNIVETNDTGGLFAALSNNKNIGSIVMKPLAGGAFDNPNLALRYIVEKQVTVVIPGMGSVEEVEANAKAGSNFIPLSEEEKRELEAEAGDLGDSFCRRCEYCLPCPQGIKIPTALLLMTYYDRYDLGEWAKERYEALQINADKCIKCGKCEERCPYDLPIIEKVARAGNKLKVGDF